MKSLIGPAIISFAATAAPGADLSYPRGNPTNAYSEALGGLRALESVRQCVERKRPLITMADDITNCMDAVAEGERAALDALARN
jgi:hypothetical protein